MDATYLILGLGAFFAGCVDAVVGGGGLIQIPLLFTTFPTQGTATLFGTNKLASVVGTSSAAWRYARRIAVPWKVIAAAALAAGAGSWIGARAVAYFPPAALRPVMLALLIAVALYTFVRKDFGVSPDASASPSDPWRRAVFIGAGVGFYDGFFGPGTGSFLIFLFVRALNWDFLRASVAAKIVNMVTNVAAIGFFVSHGEVLWRVAAVMALCNLCGAQLGSGLALRHGAPFVRRAFLLVACVLIVRFALDTFRI